MSVLPEPGTDFIKKTETAMFNFIWGGKRDRIKRATLKAKYKSGGLQVPDIVLKSKSLKIGWIKKYVDPDNKAKWKFVMKQKLSLNERTTIFDCDLDQETLHKWLGSQFWEETCSAWMSIKQTEECSGGNTLSQVIWGNRNIRSVNSGLFSRRLMINRGIVRVMDIYNADEKRLMTSNEVSQRYDIHPITALSIIRSIPEAWKLRIRMDKPTAPDIPESFVTLKSTLKVVKWAYWELKEQEQAPVREKCHEKWQDYLHRMPNPAPQIQWSSVYDRLHLSTNDVNLRWLQYRIVKRILPTNRLLYIMGLSETDKCKICPMYSENITHKIWLCPSVRLLWLGVKELLGLRNHLTNKDIILGLHLRDVNQSMCANTVIMLTNQYIWKEKDYPEHLKFDKLKRFIHRYLTIENYISRVTAKESQFGEIWGRLWEHLRGDQNPQ